MVPTEIESWLSIARLPLTEVAKRVDQAVRALCDRNNYAYISRKKTDGSLFEKLETGRVASLDDIDDLFACAVIIPNLTHEESVLASLDGMFACHSLKKRGSTQKAPDIFRFDATRFVGQLRLPEDGDSLVDSRLREFLFEIQIRTAFEHAWSVATHTNAYKGQKVDWKLERLAAQMKALVEQLDALAIAYEDAASTLIAHPHSRTDCQVQIIEAFGGLAEQGRIPSECCPERWGLFAKNLVALADTSDWGQRLWLEEKVQLMVTVVSNQLSAQKFPLSLSLYQFTLGALVQTGTIKPWFRDERYFPPITGILESIFPKTKEITQRCILSRPSTPIIVL